MKAIERDMLKNDFHLFLSIQAKVFKIWLHTFVWNERQWLCKTNLVVYENWFVFKPLKRLLI